MKVNPSKLMKLAAAGFTSFGFVPFVSAGTLLQFGGTSTIGGNQGTPPMDESYGDNVSASNTVTGIVASAGVQGIVGTPDITVQYNLPTGTTANSGFDSYPSWNGRGAVLQTDFNGENPMALDFTPAAGKGVLISSFDLDEYAGGGASVVNWSIVNGETVIVSGTWNDFEVANGGRSTVLTGMTEAQAIANSGSTLSLRLALAGGGASYQALDNLAFDQVSTGPAIDVFASDSEYVTNPVNLTWTIANPDSGMVVTLNDGVTPLDVTTNTNLTTGEGSVQVSPTTNTTYTLSVNGGTGRTLQVILGEALSLNANPKLALAPEHETTLTWEIRPVDAGLVTIFDGTSTIDVTADTDPLTGLGSRVVTVPNASTIFTIDANNSGNTAQTRVLKEAAGSAALSLTSSSITSDGTLTVNWTGAAAGPTDWIGIYRVNEIPGVQNSLQWNYLNGTRTAGAGPTDGSMTFSGLPVGEYYAVMLLNDGYELAQGPLKFGVVTPPPPGPSLMKVLEVSRDGDEFKVVWESREGFEYDVYASDTLDGDPLIDWNRVGFAIPAEVDGSTEFIEDLGVSTPERRFYQVFEYPSL